MSKTPDAERFGGPGSSHQDREHPGKNHQPTGHKGGGGPTQAAPSPDVAAEPSDSKGSDEGGDKRHKPRS